MSAAPCKVCALGRHVECFSVLSPHPDDRCGCYDADPERHETPEAHHFAMFGDFMEEDEW